MLPSSRENPTTNLLNLGSQRMAAVYAEQIATGSDCGAIIGAATADPSCYHFGEILDLPQIQQLAGGPNQAQLELLQIFAYGTLSDFRRSGSTMQLSPEQKLKLQRLTLVSMCSNNKLVKYDDLMRELTVASVRELEDLVIDAIYEGLVQGKLCQTQQCFHVTAAIGRDVRDEDIDSMLTLLGAWNEKSKGMLGTIQGNIQDAQKAGAEKQAATDAFDARKEVAKTEVQEKIKNGEKGSGGSGVLGAFGMPNFTTGRPGKIKGRR